jgi:V8-like Glu-specific endopeptidase
MRRGATRGAAAGGNRLPAGSRPPAGSRRPPVTVVLASVTTVILVFMLVQQHQHQQPHQQPHPQNTARLSDRLTAAVQSLAQDAELSPGRSPQARPFGGTPAVGALFDWAGGRLVDHFCTASVIGGPNANLVLTAAHCVSGRTPGRIVFVPGYHAGALPYGIWPVTRVIVNHAWASSADPDDDVAFLIVGRHAVGRHAVGRHAVGRRGHRDLAGVTGAERVSFAEPYGQMVAVAGYPSSSNAPIRCQNQVRWFSAEQLQFDCGGYSVGTSGSPLLAGVSPASGLGTVIGVIGGYELGGDTPDVSYAARFGPGVAALYRTAIAQS